MTSTIHRIRVGMNCYLLRGREGFVLIDTGMPAMSGRLLREMERAGCGPEDLRLIVLTHADLDHVGNCAALRGTYDAPIAAHELEAKTLATGDANWNRKPSPDRIPFLFKAMIGFGRRFGSTPGLEVDTLLRDGESLEPYGLNATVLHLPGHSKGSLAVLTAEGDLFCGDLLAHRGRRPGLHMLIDDLPTARASVARIRALPLRTVYPGHGEPFSADRLPMGSP